MGPKSAIFKNARLTTDETAGIYSILIKDGLVSRICDPALIEDTRADAIFDLAGGYVAPSMEDNHVHVSVWAKMRARVSLNGVHSLFQALALLDNAFKSTFKSLDPVSQPVLVGQGLLLGKWPDEDLGNMHKATLDTCVNAQIPVVVYTNDLHTLWCNTRALEWLEVPLEAEGYSSGLLREQECFSATVALNSKEESVLGNLLLEASKDAAKKGVTSIVDLDWDFNIANWTKRSQNGLDYLRVQCGMYREHLPQAIAAGHKSGDVIAGTNGLVTVGPFKIISDGSLGTRTACCHQAYPSPPAARDDYGLLSYTAEDFKSMFELADKHAFRLAIHTIGDKTASVVLDQLETLERPPLPGSTFEHAQLMRWEDLPRMKALGLIASVQPQHLNDDRELSARFWPGLTDRAFAYKAMVDAGIELRLGSDAPVAALDPWVAMAAAVSRLRKGEKGEGWHPEQKISMEQAYRASTSGGRLQVKEGDVADICILPLDPLRASVDQIWDMQPKATMLAGRFTWNDL